MAKVAILHKQEMTLEEEIDLAGQLNQQIGAMKKQYDGIRESIQMKMEIPENQMESSLEGDEFVATLKYPEETIIDPRALFKANKELFWQIVNVPVKTARENLPGDVFHEISSVQVGEVPQLSIRKRK